MEDEYWLDATPFQLLSKSKSLRDAFGINGSPEIVIRIILQPFILGRSDVSEDVIGKRHADLLSLYRCYNVLSHTFFIL
jgi:hypothetical protein